MWEDRVRRFEDGTLPFERWNHRAHLDVAVWYLRRHPRPEALERIRGGIQRYNAAHGVEQTETGGYHETLTVVFARLVGDLLEGAPPGTDEEDLLDEVWEACGDTRLPLEFYERDTLMSWEARTGWVEPDRRRLEDAWEGRAWVVRADPDGPDARDLVARLSADLGRRYGDDGTGLYRPEDAEVFLVAWLGGTPVACGALCRRAADVAEVKRMYVAPEARRRGLAGRILARLETLAARSGVRTVLLETGTLQPEALALYESAGYSRRAPYGPYVGDPRSVCFEKPIEHTFLH